MTAPFDPARSRETWWEDEGSRIAGELGEISAVLVMGTNAEQAARVALGIARAESTRRHVALGDLVGDLAPLYAVAGGDDAFGLTDCLRQQLPLNDIARPAPDRSSLFILPAGSPPVSSLDVIAHERWPKLVNGFAKAGALLVLVTEPDAPGIAALESATAGVVLVDTPSARAASFRVLATAGAPELPREPLAPRHSQSPFWRWMLIVGAIALVAAAGWYAWHRSGRDGEKNIVPLAAPASAAVADKPVPARTPDATSAMSLTDTVRLSDPVNPADSSLAVAFAVEVMAANTLAGANSFLANNAKSKALSGATVSPVAVGSPANVWYKVVAGAVHARAGADSLLSSVRHERLVRGGEGRVVKVPYALVLADHIARTDVAELVRTWRQRGFAAYALMQPDESVRVLAGAFETPAQAAPLASALRAAGVAPILVFRTGRMF